jgi:signal transduction histidine kinase
MLVPRIPIIHRLFTRLLLSHILLVSIPLLILGQILVSAARNTIEQTIFERNLEFAQRSSWPIRAMLGRARDLLHLSAQSPTFLVADRMGQELIINNLVNQHPIFRKISVFDSSGREISSTLFGALIAPEKRAAALEQVRKKERYASEVYVAEEKLPLMDLAEPIIVFEEMAGFLWAEVDLKTIWTLVDSNLVGKGSEAFIFRKDGQFIAHRDRRKVLGPQYFERSDIVKAVAEGRRGHKIYQTAEGVEMLAVYAPIAEENWGIVIQQPTREAFAPTRAIRFQIFALMILGVIIAALVAALYTQQIVKPVNQLLQGIEIISRGDLNYKVPRLGRDELGTLAFHFNAMTGKLRRIQKKLQRSQRLELLNKLSAVLSHEIRNPLNSMVINMQLLRREFNKPEVDLKKLNHFYQILSSEIRRVDDLVSNFLLIARPPRLEKTPQRLEDLLNNLIKVEVPEVLPKGIRVTRKFQVPSVEVKIDAKKIYQVFLNIFLNAVQAMPGGGHLAIGLGVHTRKLNATLSRQYAVVTFEDSGKGIRKEHLPKIFDFYFSTKKEGSGIGLAIAQQIVEKHGGKIIVKSKTGQGSKFAVYLPLNSAED